MADSKKTNESTKSENGAAEQTPPVLDPEVVNPGSPSKDERLWGTFAHLSALAGYVVAIPFGNLIGPLVIWLIKRDEMPFVKEQGKEAVNFNISVGIYMVVSALLMLVVIGFLCMIATGIFHLVCTIIAAIKANEGKSFRYPLCIRFIK